MTIRNGGKASFTGTYTLPNGAYAFIRDANSQLSTTGLLQVYHGSRIDANGAGLISAGALDLGMNANGIIVVDGVGSRLTSGDAYIGGGGGTGSLTLQNGAYGVIGTGTAYVGLGTAGGSCGIVLVQGEANLVFTGPLWVGTSAGGAQTSTVTVTGSNSSITQSGAIALIVGAAGGSTGVIHVDSNGTFTGGTGLTTINRTGTVSVNGGFYKPKGNILIDGGALDVSAGTLNWDANRTMTIRNGGRFTISDYYDTPIGSYILVQDANSRIQVTELNVLNGGRLDANNGATISVPGGLMVGTDGNGTVVVDGNGTSLTTSQVYAGSGVATGSVTIQNNATGDLGAVQLASSGIIGSKGSLTVQGGANATASDIEVGVGGLSGQAGTLVVTGIGSSLTQTGSWSLLTIGASSNSTGVLNVSLGGLFRQGTSPINTCITAQIGDGNTILNATGVITIDGGSVALGKITLNGGTLNFSSGAFGFDGNLPVGPLGLFGSALTLGSDRSLAVRRTTTVGSGGVLTLDGGEFSTGQLVINGAFVFNSGTLALTGQNLTIGAGGLFGANFTLNSSCSVYVQPGTTTVGAGSSLTMNGGLLSTATLANSGTIFLNGGTIVTSGSTLQNQASGRMFVHQDAIVALYGPVSNAGRITLEGGGARVDGNGVLTNTGVITGDGEIGKSITNAGTGEIRAEAGKTMLLSGPNGTNTGKVNVLGGTVEFLNALTNGAGGQINGRGTFIFTGGLANTAGQVSLSAGLSDVFGQVSNDSLILVTGGGTSTFYDRVHNHPSGEIRVSTGSTAVFLGGVDGNGTFSGPGTKIFEDGVSDVGGIATPGSTIVLPTAQVTADYFRENALTVDGLANVRPSGQAGGTSMVGGLTMNGGPSAYTGRLDLTDNGMIVKYGGGASPLDPITAMIASGHGAGDWRGFGVTSSTIDGNYQAVGVVDNATLGYTEFLNLPVDANVVIIKPVWGGDADLDGDVTGLDYGAIDFAYATNNPESGPPPDVLLTGWQNGDFDYDGAITGLDYGFIDFVYATLHPESGGVSGTAGAVPEPTTVALLALGGLAATRRRSRGGQATS